MVLPAGTELLFEGSTGHPVWTQWLRLHNLEKTELSFILNLHSQKRGKFNLFLDQFISLHFLGRSLHRGLRWTCPLWGRRSWWQWRESWRPRTRIRRFGRWFLSLEFAEKNESESASMLHQLTVRLYQHSSKYGTTEAAKTMMNTLKGKT